MPAKGSRVGVSAAATGGESTVPSTLGGTVAGAATALVGGTEAGALDAAAAAGGAGLVDAEQPMVWRGPMVTQALTQLLGETRWGELDYLVVDMPPGTGDTQLTLAQRVPVAGAIVVTTPQDIALLDARKGLQMFRKVEVPVLGIVENMATHVCSACGHEEPIFGAGGGARMAEQYGVPLLGSLPLDLRIREQADGGRPTVVAEPDGRLARAYLEIARRAAARLASGAAATAFPTLSASDD